jgi:hypothetical protein
MTNKRPVKPLDNRTFKRELKKHENDLAHKRHKKLIHRLVVWGGLGILLAFTKHELALKGVEFIAASILDILIQWD